LTKGRCVLIWINTRTHVDEVQEFDMLKRNSPGFHSICY